MYLDLWQVHMIGSSESRSRTSIYSWNRRSLLSKASNVVQDAFFLYALLALLKFAIASCRNQLYRYADSASFVTLGPALYGRGRLTRNLPPAILNCCKTDANASRFAWGPREKEWAEVDPSQQAPGRPSTLSNLAPRASCSNVVRHLVKRSICRLHRGAGTLSPGEGADLLPRL